MRVLGLSFDKSVISNINQAKQLRNLFDSLLFTTCCWDWCGTCRGLETATLLVLRCSADAVGSFCGSASEKLWDLWHSLRPLGLSSANVPLLMKHWGGKKKCFFGQSVSQQRAEWVTAVQPWSRSRGRREKKDKKKKAKCGKKKVQSESFCNCSHLIFPSATAALFLLAGWSSCY